MIKKIYHIIIGIVAAFTGVMMPRISNLLNTNHEEEANKKINKSVETERKKECQYDRFD